MDEVNDSDRAEYLSVGVPYRGKVIIPRYEPREDGKFDGHYAVLALGFREIVKGPFETAQEAGDAAVQAGKAAIDAAWENDVASDDGYLAATDEPTPPDSEEPPR